MAGCEIAPVLMEGQSDAGRFSDCDRASTTYCEQVVNPPTQELDQCIAEHIYRLSRGIVSSWSVAPVGGCARVLPV